MFRTELMFLSMVRTVFGDYMQVFRLGGASFESADDEPRIPGERLNVLWRNIASPNIAMWAQVVACSTAALPLPGQRDSRPNLATSIADGWPPRRSWLTSFIWRCCIGPLSGLARSGCPALSRALDAAASRLDLTMRWIPARNWADATSLARSLRARILGIYRTGAWCSSLLDTWQS